MREQARYFPQEFSENARERGVENIKKPADRVVIYATEALTPLGTMPETYEAILQAKSGVKSLPEAENYRTNIGAPIEFTPSDHYSVKELKRMDTVVALADHLSRNIAKKVDLLGSDGKLKSTIDAERFSIWIGSGLGPTSRLINIGRTIEEGVDKKTGEKSRIQGGLDLDFNEGTKVFPQDLSGRPAMSIGARGWSGSTVAACATGASNIAELYRLIKDGYADAGIAGGVEYALNSHPRETIAIFARMGLTSARNDAPHEASRPFDKDRDGFIPGSGGAVLGLASEEFAKAHGLPILGEVYNAYNSIDGYLPTGMHTDNVSKTLLRSLYDERNDSYYRPDVFLAHATSTKDGDPNEVEVLRKSFGEVAKEIPITAIKGNLGHLLGGAGSINAAVAVEIINQKKIPPIANHQTPDVDFADLDFVTETYREQDVFIASAVAYGFGGFNAAITIGAY